MQIRTCSLIIFQPFYHSVDFSAAAAVLFLYLSHLGTPLPLKRLGLFFNWFSGDSNSQPSIVWTWGLRPYYSNHFRSLPVSLTHLLLLSLSLSAFKTFYLSDLISFSLLLSLTLFLSTYFHFNFYLFIALSLSLCLTFSCFGFLFLSFSFFPLQKSYSYFRQRISFFVCFSTVSLSLSFSFSLVSNLI